MRQVRGVGLLMAAVCCLLALGGAGSTSAADDYPTKTIRLVVPFPAGAYTDAVARILGEKVSGPLGVPIVIENRAGAAGNVGASAVAKSEPDGYTLLMGTVASTISPSIYKKLAYDIKEDLQPVSLVVRLPFALVIHPSIPARSLGEFIAYARSKADGLNYASSGVGSALHLASELFSQRAGLKMVHVPYGGIGPALNDVVGGHVPIVFSSLDTVLGNIREGKLVALAVTSADRTKHLPDVPALEEVFPGVEILAWAGVLAPARTPLAIVAKLNKVINQALQTSDIKERFAKFAAEPLGGTPEQFARFIERDIVKWAAVAQDAGFKPN